jgi:hypothetical protein
LTYWFSHTHVCNTRVGTRWSTAVGTILAARLSGPTNRDWRSSCEARRSEDAAHLVPRGSRPRCWCWCWDCNPGSGYTSSCPGSGRPPGPSRTAGRSRTGRSARQSRASWHPGSERPGCLGAPDPGLSTAAHDHGQDPILQLLRRQPPRQRHRVPARLLVTWVAVNYCRQPVPESSQTRQRAQKPQVREARPAGIEPATIGLKTSRQ